MSRLTSGVFLFKNDPGWRVVAGAFFAGDPAVNPTLGQPRCKSRAQQEMIEPQPGVAWPAVTLVIPEREHRLGWMHAADCIAPALCDQRLECGPALRLNQRILVP